jgi:hypothetical protein
MFGIVAVPVPSTGQQLCQGTDLLNTSATHFREEAKGSGRGTIVQLIDSRITSNRLSERS